MSSNAGMFGHQPNTGQSSQGFSPKESQPDPRRDELAPRETEDYSLDSYQKEPTEEGVNQESTKFANKPSFQPNAGASSQPPNANAPQTSQKAAAQNDDDDDYEDDYEDDEYGDDFD